MIRTRAETLQPHLADPTAHLLIDSLGNAADALNPFLLVLSGVLLGLGAGMLLSLASRGAEEAEASLRRNRAELDEAFARTQNEADRASS